MPRAFDSDEVSRSTGRGRLHFTERVECPDCSLELEGDFYDSSLTVEDMVEPPSGRHTCPACGRVWSSQMTGWLFYTEAG